MAARRRTGSRRFRGLFELLVFAAAFAMIGYVTMRPSPDTAVVTASTVGESR